MRLARIPAALAVILGLSASASAQDDAMERLMRKLDPPAPSADEPKARGDVGERDRSVDSLLERFGRRDDRPDASGPAPRGGAPDAGPPGGEAQPRELDERERDLDRHLRRLLGRLDPPEEQDDQQGNEGGPLSETMKKMREVEQRLAKLDTGDETRERQEQIVRDFDELLRRIRQQQRSQQQQQGDTQMAGQQQRPGDQPGQDANDPDDRGGGAPPQMPDQSQAIANAKDTWGHLQGAMRDIMGNVSRMLPLDGKRELIERYFLSVAKRNVDR